MRALTISNRQLRASVVPERGGKIDQITDLESGKDWLWHPPRGASRDHGEEPPNDGSFDDSWTGGWDDIFPNDTAGPFDRFNGLDHGELWRAHWQVHLASDHSVTLRHSCETLPIDVEKRIRVHDEAPTLTIDYILRNRSTEDMPYLLKMHPALAVEEGDEILLPPGTVISPVAPEFSTAQLPGTTSFPFVRDRSGRTVPIHRARSARANSREFFYSSGLNEGWCGLRDSKTGATFKIRFDLRKTPYVWVLQSYGGWRGHHVLLLEPCTTVPYDINSALSQGTCPVLKGSAEESLHFEVRLD